LIADQELDVEVPHDAHSAAVQLRVQLLEPAAALVEALHREVRRIALVLRRVRQAPEVSAVETDLRDLGTGVVDEGQISRIAVRIPVRDHAPELEPRRLGAQ
jgi:hypothetical protein